MEKVRLVKLLLLITAFLIKTSCAFAQRPPAGGPNPPIPPESNSQLILYSAIGVAVGVATYFIIKEKPTKIPTVDHLQAFLLKENILPTADAITLMYALNPRLKQNPVIRSNRKIIKPDFPALPDTQTYRLSTQLLNSNSVPSVLTEQVGQVKTTLKSFHRVRATAKNSNLNKAAVISDLQTLEKEIATIEKNAGEINSIKAQLLMDLLRAANQTLKKNIASKSMTEPDAALYHSISENLSEFISPTEAIKSSFYRIPNYYPQKLPASGTHLYASSQAKEGAPSAELNLPNRRAGGFPNFEAKLDFTTPSPTKENMLKSFAFAVYKMNSEGKPITKGPEVEGQYFIQYVLPALKDFTEYYHNVSPPLATYASANLPPAKYYLIVKDSNFKPVALLNPLIDTRDAFMNPQREHIDEKKEVIKIAIFITP